MAETRAAPSPRKGAPSAAAPHAGRASSEAAPSFALYVHWPFCRSKCPYCDFNSHVRDAVDHGRWRDAYLAEIERYAKRTPGRRLASIFFGGGTPSLMEPANAAAIIAAARRAWTATDDLEITLEANPTSVEAGRFAEFRAAGVNRASIGVQSLDPAALRFLGREHSPEEALAAVALARETFPRYSLDLIYALPGQTVTAWRDELSRALDHAGDHISAYQLTIEKGTPFYAEHRAGRFALPPDDTATDLFEATQHRLDEAGMPAYEISNHAHPGAECRHNLVYWRYGEYVGIGPGAHGRFVDCGTTRATEQFPAPEAWLTAVERGDGTRAETELSAADALEEATLVGLRLNRGLDREAFERRLGRRLEDAYDAGRLTSLAAAGLLEIDREGLRATPEGLMRLNAVISALLT